MQDDILNFIYRRFQKDCDWTNGNCYYFALILKTRFKIGKIVYDVINGHFLYQQNNVNYDWTGIVYDVGYLVDWENFEKYDPIQKDRIIRNCIE